MIYLIKKFAFRLLGRRTAYRLGRALYMYARGELANDMNTNGEIFIQKCVLKALKHNPPSRYPVFFDVGANVGNWSTALLRNAKEHSLEEQVRIYAFEPVPATVEALKLNLAYPRPNLHIETTAFSFGRGEADIFIFSATTGTNSLYEDHKSNNKTKITILLDTATDFCKTMNIEHVHLLKCDTEGHDMEVIRGSLPLLVDERISILQFEYNHRWIYSRNSLRDVFDIIQSLPYVVAKLQPDHVIVFDRWHPELDRFFDGNYALIHSEAMSWIPHLYAEFDRWNSVSIARK